MAIKTAGASEWPQRKCLPHEIPWWVAQGARHFITMNARQREASPFAAPDVAQALLANLMAYEAADKWYVYISVIMPDHLHFIASVNLDLGPTRCITAWKRYQTRALKLSFQSGYFEHRIRNDAEYAEKADYIRNNPVRRGLVDEPWKWPYTFDRFAKEAR